VADPGGKHVSGWDVDWGDAQSTHYDTPTFALPTPTHVYTAPGDHTVSVTPIDSDFPSGLPAISRLTFDAGFGTPGLGGRVIANFAGPSWGGNAFDYARAMTGDAAGRVIVGGYNDNGFALARFNLGSTADIAYAVEIDEQGSTLWSNPSRRH
jgi:hypothetical protein